MHIEEAVSRCARVAQTLLDRPGETALVASVAKEFMRLSKALGDPEEGRGLQCLDVLGDGFDLVVDPLLAAI